jgi:hypothetical protein
MKAVESPAAESPGGAFMKVMMQTIFNRIDRNSLEISRNDHEGGGITRGGITRRCFHESYDANDFH